jgi:hypothetical protein
MRSPRARRTSPDQIALISYLMLETGAADWPRPEPPRRAYPAAGTSAGGIDADVAARYPSFWNHLMTNTTRYRLRAGSEELRFDACFGTDGSVASRDPRFREDLWTSQPAEGVSLTGGIVAGRPSLPGPDAPGRRPGARVPRAGSE